MDIKKITERNDAWWRQWILMASALTIFLLYAGWATLQGKNYLAGPYRSPFYPFDIRFFNLSPAIIVFWIPVLFRLTCYYWRKVYYRSYFLDPPGCAVEELRKGYNGETRFPFILQNLHRYFVYLAILLLLWHWKDTIHSFYYGGKLGLGVGSIIILADSVFLTIYVASCHALRHILGGRINKFSNTLCSRCNYQVWRGVSVLNERHGIWAWISLVTVILADLYVRLLVSGVISDVNTWQEF